MAQEWPSTSLTDLPNTQLKKIKQLLQVALNALSPNVVNIHNILPKNRCHMCRIGWI